VKIAVLVEGRTETAFKTHLVEFLKIRLAGRMPNLDFFPYDGRIPKEDKLRRTVEGLLSNGRNPSDAVIALTDVYTGTDDFADATDAKGKMRDGWGRTIGSILTPHSMISRLGCFPFGVTFRRWPDTKKALHPDVRKA
jgi:hypothetical protein